MEKYIQYELTEEEYGVIKLNRPEKRNAISLQMAYRLLDVLKQARKDDHKFLVLTSSNDDVFCAGGDLQDYHGGLQSEEAFTHLYAMKEVLFELISFPVPTICLLNGKAIGGGCELATACDIRIAKSSTSFGFIQANLGITPGWGGGSLLYEKVHSSFAFHWITEASIYDALDLHNKGWIHQVVLDKDWNDSCILKPYIKNSADQMKILKSQYKDELNSHRLSAKMNEEVRHCASLWNSDQHKQAVNNFLTKK